MDSTVARLLHGLRVATLVITLATLFGLALPSLVANADFYRGFTQELVAYGMVLVITAIAGVDLRKRLPEWLRWLLLAALLVASAIAVLGVRPQDLTTGESEWSFGVVGWVALLLLLDRSPLATVPFLVLANAVVVVQMLATGQDVLRFAIGGVLVLGYELPFVAASTVLRTFAANTAEMARKAAEVRTAEALAAQIQEDRKARYAALADTAIPLLADLSAGTVDLTDDRVRTRYAVEAARMRRMFAEGDDVPDPLLHELRACLDLAERRGITVHLDTWGERPVPPVAARRALTEPVVRALAGTASAARVTVLGATGEVTVSVVTDSPVTVADTDPSVRVTTMTEGDRVWVEATWRA
ncbi:hypothetical protein GCM10029964_020920 [Kibdelosporangium lantanae]